MSVRRFSAIPHLRGVCRTTSVVLELVFGLLAFPAGSPLAVAGGRSAKKTAFTSVNLVNLVGQSLSRVPQSVYRFMAV